nr:RHS repeat-associated core domain-containing protein [Pseudomonas atagonensis]
MRTVADDPVQALVIRLRHNSAGRMVEQQDPRLPVPNLVNVFGLSDQPLRVDSVDSGWRLALPGPAGEILQRWDARQFHWRMNYDPQVRLVAAEESTHADSERFTYADGLADHSHNLRGKLTALTDPSGALRLDSYDLTGLPLRETRDILGDIFISRRTFSPLGALLTQTDAGGHQQQMHYSVTGQLHQVSLQLKDETRPKQILQAASYNAAGQIVEQLTANGIITTWTYDPADNRLMSQKSGMTGEKPRLYLTYQYDPMGNVLRIEDHTLTTVYFANQQVESHRDFAYDSLYRLIRASGFEGQAPHLQPGLPELISPIDTGRRYNYVEHFEYDKGNNLIELRHVREGNCHTRRMCIDPFSNRGLPCKTAEPEPIFDEHFDPHGNLTNLHPNGQQLGWNIHDQLEKAILLRHRNGLPDDEETYRYSQGERVYKSRVSHTFKTSHCHDVHYLPGLEIHTRNDGQILHVISLPLALGNVRCLHWHSGQPEEIEQNQLRFHGDDHLGSCTIELDGHGALLSLEFYYPYGGTAWRATRKIVEADYKTIRYGAREMDASGLYFFGARYYAPWLWRWISADPQGDIDGLNLYAMVGNNPMRYIDRHGTEREESAARQQITEYSNLLEQVNGELKKLNYQLYNLTRTRDIYKTAGKKLAFSVVTFFAAIKAGAIGASIGGAAGSVTGPAAPIVAPVTAAIGGVLAAEATARVMEKIGEETTLGYSIMPDPAALSVKSLKSKAASTSFSLMQIADSFNPNTSQGLIKTGIEATARTVGKHLGVPYLKQALNIARQMAHLTEALNDSWGQGDLNQVNVKLDELTVFLDSEEAKALTNASMVEDAAEFSALEQEMKVARSALKQSRNLLGRVSAHLDQKHRAA